MVHGKTIDVYGGEVPHRVVEVMFSGIMRDEGDIVFDTI